MVNPALAASTEPFTVEAVLSSTSLTALEAASTPPRTMSGGWETVCATDCAIREVVSTAFVTDPAVLQRHFLDVRPFLWDLAELQPPRFRLGPLFGRQKSRPAWTAWLRDMRPSWQSRAAARVPQKIPG